MEKFMGRPLDFPAALLVPRQVVFVALLIVGAAAVGGGEDAVVIVLVEIHAAEVFVGFLVVIVVPAGFTKLRIQGAPLLSFSLSYHIPPKKETLSVEFFREQ